MTNTITVTVHSVTSSSAAEGWHLDSAISGKCTGPLFVAAEQEYLPGSIYTLTESANRYPSDWDVLLRKDPSDVSLQPCVITYV